MKKNERNIVSHIGERKEERLELLNKKIKEKFNTNEEFFKNFRFKEETFKRKLFEGQLSLNEYQKTLDLLNINFEEIVFIFFGEKPEEDTKFLIPEEEIEGQSEEVKNFLRDTNTILKGKSIEEREIFLKDLQKTLENDSRGSETK